MSPRPRWTLHRPAYLHHWHLDGHRYQCRPRPSSELRPRRSALLKFEPCLQLYLLVRVLVPATALALDSAHPVVLQALPPPTEPEPLPPERGDPSHIGYDGMYCDLSRARERGPSLIAQRGRAVVLCTPSEAKDASQDGREFQAFTMGDVGQAEMGQRGRMQRRSAQRGRPSISVGRSGLWNEVEAPEGRELGWHGHGAREWGERVGILGRKAESPLCGGNEEDELVRSIYKRRMQGLALLGLLLRQKNNLYSNVRERWRTMGFEPSGPARANTRNPSTDKMDENISQCEDVLPYLWRDIGDIEYGR
ncbi:hypothetical protein L227DRAFT_565650 [Lentinus tigrinus ALCF2SS1-6]|uniref:Uncharacterized protein n=1 Tax=Lentinus tigrinus ALCF2SS1-6 TaxID=1328759 RepID=A0A5C2S148_9APHY|nr:hypothetical protein L227DRAFT_565650 [Lentinus tigrinus ALCF2SS1-6]